MEAPVAIMLFMMGENDLGPGNVNCGELGDLMMWSWLPDGRMFLDVGPPSTHPGWDEVTIRAYLRDGNVFVRTHTNGKLLQMVTDESTRSEHPVPLWIPSTKSSIKLLLSQQDERRLTLVEDVLLSLKHTASLAMSTNCLLRASHDIILNHEKQKVLLDTKNRQRRYRRIFASLLRRNQPVSRIWCQS